MKYQSLNIFFYEIKKSHLINFHNKMIYFSLLIWPVIMFFSAYFSYKPFEIEDNELLLNFLSKEELPLFLLIGYLGFMFYFVMVQSAFQMSHERTRGTLEIIFLSPVSRMAMIYGRALGNLIEGVWLFLIFTVLGFFYYGNTISINLWAIFLSLLLLSLSAVIWGGLLNTVLLFSRDAGIFFEIVLEPMNFFSGVRLPILMLPLWGQIISSIFPLSFVLKISRDTVIRGQSLTTVIDDVGYLLINLIIYVLITKFIMAKAEQNSQETGSMTLF
ncbi:ABC transporter permease [Bacillus salitolerans]|uniref:Transport permease protein n=1 Tax=Bacillus salitolerans TaxID=1437434 RepID=A0ABW4LLL8_9BACI